MFVFVCAGRGLLQGVPRPRFYPRAIIDRRPFPRRVRIARIKTANGNEDGLNNVVRSQQKLGKTALFYAMPLAGGGSELFCESIHGSPPIRCLSRFQRGRSRLCQTRFGSDQRLRKSSILAANSRVNPKRRVDIRDRIWSPRFAQNRNGW